MKKKIIEDIEHIKSTLDYMTKETFYKAQKYDEWKTYLNNIKFQTKSHPTFNKNDGSCGVVVNYSLSLNLILDDNNEIIGNDVFKAINMLNLISLEDMNNISETIKAAIKQNKSTNGE